MGELKLNYEDSMAVLEDPDAGHGARAIAGCAVAFFQVRDAAGEIDPQTRAIAHRLLRMTAGELDEATKGAGE